MNEEEPFEPIEPSEPLRPGPTPIRISPGRDPELRPLEPVGSPRLEKVPAPNPLDEPPWTPADDPNDGRSGRPPVRWVSTLWPDPDPRRSATEISLPFHSVDTISHYNSFRGGVSPPDPDLPFGIVVSRSGFSIYVAALRAKHPVVGEKNLREAAWRFIVTHQIHHFLVDRAVSSIQATFDVGGQPLPHDIWQTFHLRHGRSSQGYSTLEESACCAYSLRNARRGHHHLTATLTGLQPTGYRLQHPGGRFIGQAGTWLSHQQAVSRLLCTYIDDKTSSRALGIHGLMLYADHLRGTGGDLFVSDGSTRVEIPVHVAK